MKGDRLYQLALNKALTDDVDLNEVFTLLMKAKRVNNYKAVYALATWYLFGKHVKKDVNKAFELLLKAACKYFLAPKHWLKYTYPAY